MNISPKKILYQFAHSLLNLIVSIGRKFTADPVCTYVIFIDFRGKFGRVMRCRHYETGDYFAAKFVLYTRKDERENVEREVEIMNTLGHPKLLYLFDAYDNGRTEMCLITE